MRAKSCTYMIERCELSRQQMISHRVALCMYSIGPSPTVKYLMKITLKLKCGISNYSQHARRFGRSSNDDKM